MTDRKTCEWLESAAFEKVLIEFDYAPESERQAARRALDDFIRARVEEERKDEREACAAFCGRLAQHMEGGGGEEVPGDRLRQAERMILRGHHYPFEEPDKK